jgi:tRNA 2-selenouridine synthase
LTGTGKTHILRQLGTKGSQILDLEKLANHRGSLLGEEWTEKPTSQPAQKWFESLLLQELQKLDINQTVWVESESNKIGRLYLPATLWDALKKAKSCEIQLPLGERIDWLLQQYPHLTTSPDLLKSKLILLKYRCGSKIIQQWHDLIDQKKWRELVENLLIYHYDPAYLRSLGQTYHQVEKQINIPDLSPQNVDRAIELILNN